MSVRLDQVFGRLTNDEVAQRLREAGADVSKETVRRYRGGLAERIAADFVGDVARVFDADPRWLLTGEVAGSQLPQTGRAVAEQPGVYGRGSATAGGASASGSGSVGYGSPEEGEWFRDFEQTVRLVGGRDGVPDGERKALQKDLINSMIEARRQRGADADALYVMLGKAERGEL